MGSKETGSWRREISPAEEPINSPSSQREKARKIMSMS